MVGNKGKDAQEFNVESLDFSNLGVMNDDKDAKMAIKDLSDEKKVKWYSETDDEEIRRIVSALGVSHVLLRYGIDITEFLKVIIDEKFKLRVSNLRQGRQEFIKGFQGEIRFNQDFFPGQNVGDQQQGGLR